MPEVFTSFQSKASHPLSGVYAKRRVVVADSLVNSQLRINSICFSHLVGLCLFPQSTTHASSTLPDDETPDPRVSSVDKIPIIFWGEEYGQQSVSALALFFLSFLSVFILRERDRERQTETEREREGGGAEREGESENSKQALY